MSHESDKNEHLGHENRPNLKRIIKAVVATWVYHCVRISPWFIKIVLVHALAKLHVQIIEVSRAKQVPNPYPIFCMFKICNLVYWCQKIAIMGIALND